MKIRSGWDIKDYDDAKAHAVELTEATGELHIATDAGEWRSPRYNVIVAPKVGEPVSYAFNGDYYPDGYITKISKTMKVVTTDTGSRYYRRRETGSWIKHGTWSMVHGHIERQNPHF